MPAKKEARSNQLVPLTLEVAGKQVLNIHALEPELRKKVLRFDGQLKDAMQRFGASVLEMGQALSEIRLLLEPRRDKSWGFYLNTIPGFSQATAYRYINSYELATEKLPKPILDKVLMTGIKMIPTKDRAYGDYTEAVTKVGKPPTDENKASDWLAAVQAEHDKLKKKGAIKKPDAIHLQRDAYRSVVQKYSKVTEGQQVQWLRKLFAYILHDVGLEGALNIMPEEPPESIRSTKAKKEEATEKK